jgi:hypothetical protein
MNTQSNWNPNQQNRPIHPVTGPNVLTLLFRLARLAGGLFMALAIALLANTFGLVRGMGERRD